MRLVGSSGKLEANVNPDRSDPDRFRATAKRLLPRNPIWLIVLIPLLAFFVFVVVQSVAMSDGEVKSQTRTKADEPVGDAGPG